MARLPSRDYTYVTTVRGMCRSCREVTPARVFIREGRVWQQSLCPKCDTQPALIAGDDAWYLEQVLQEFPDHAPLHGSRPPQKGCPHDCGPCSWHASPCQLPVVSVTNACDLNCPICFTYNRPDRVYHMPVEEMRATVDSIVEMTGSVDLINITGGEPTQHPQIIELLRVCKRPEIGRITMNSNGLRLAKDPDLCRQLADLDVCVILSFNTFDPEVSVRIHGADIVAAKLRAVENLARAGCRMGLLHVMIRGVTDDAIGRIFGLMRDNAHILSLTVQTMTYTGQGGGQWADRKHIPVDEAARIVCSQSGGQLHFDDFLPRPSAHPLCYLTSYLMKSTNTWVPFTRFATRKKLLGMMSGSYLMRLQDQKEFVTDVINDLHARGESELLGVFRGLVDRLFPRHGALTEFDRQRLAESSVRTIYIHAHMDEDTFDSSRAMLCPDHVPTEPGHLVPACTYNLFYRMKDERFYVDP